MNNWHFYLLQILSKGEPFDFLDAQGIGLSLVRGDISPFSGTNIIRLSQINKDAISSVVDFHYPSECLRYLESNYPLKSSKEVDLSGEKQRQPNQSPKKDPLIFM